MTDPIGEAKEGITQAILWSSLEFVFVVGKAAAQDNGLSE
jgi:hypothetical protein